MLTPAEAVGDPPSGPGILHVSPALEIEAHESGGRRQRLKVSRRRRAQMGPADQDAVWSRTARAALARHRHSALDPGEPAPCPGRGHDRVLACRRAIHPAQLVRERRPGQRERARYVPDPRHLAPAGSRHGAHAADAGGQTAHCGRALGAPPAADAGPHLLLPSRHVSARRWRQRSRRPSRTGRRNRLHLHSAAHIIAGSRPRGGRSQ
jgi:hypothetical protein